jgi:hypothetical protein
MPRSSSSSGTLAQIESLARIDLRAHSHQAISMNAIRPFHFVIFRG